MSARTATIASVDLIAAKVSILVASTLFALDLNASMSHVHLVNHASLPALVLRKLQQDLEEKLHQLQ